MSEADDLIGGKAEKKSKPAKGAAKKDKPVKAKKDKPAKAKKGSASRSARGEGKFYFPKDGKERQQLRNGIASRVKAPISTKDFAEKHKLPTWKVRLAAFDLVAEKKLKVEKSGKEGGVLIMKPR